MKIAILTLPLHTNYGGILQAYALQTTLNGFGHEVKVLQKQRYNSYPLSTRVKHGIHQLINGILKLEMPEYVDVQHLVNKKKKEFKICSRYTQSFIDTYISYQLIQSLYDIKEGEFDAIVVGSDQIWRQLYFTGMWEAPISDAFLKFTRGWDIKRVAYAPSFGLDNISEYPSDVIHDCTEMLKSFDAVSVREYSGINICSSFFDTKAMVVVDPTMLLDKEDYISLINDSQRCNGNLLVYVLDCNEKTDRLVYDIASKYNIQPFFVNSKIDNQSASLNDRIQPPVEQWLKGFRDADFVITDSFHACVFSIIFNKPFVVMGNKERGMARFESLLMMFNQQHRLITTTHNIDEAIITQKPNVDLTMFRHNALTFLKSALDT